MEHKITQLAIPFTWLSRQIKNQQQGLNTDFTYPCKFPMRAHARKAGPPKKLFKSSELMLKSYSYKILVKLLLKEKRKLLSICLIYEYK